MQSQAHQILKLAGTSWSYARGDRHRRLQPAHLMSSEYQPCSTMPSTVLSPNSRKNRSRRSVTIPLSLMSLKTPCLAWRQHKQGCRSPANGASTYSTTAPSSVIRHMTMWKMEVVSIHTCSTPVFESHTANSPVLVSPLARGTSARVPRLLLLSVVMPRDTPRQQAKTRTDTARTSLESSEARTLALRRMLESFQCKFSGRQGVVF